MQFFLTVTVGRNPSAPPPELQAAMTNLIDEETRAGTILLSGGLALTAQGSRVTLAGGELTVNERTGSTVAIDGFAVLEAPSMEVALRTASRVMEHHRRYVATWDVECAVRPIVTHCLP
jgi:hypothetical protein